MIVGIGNDLCDVRRIVAAQQRHGEPFARRILGEREQLVWQRRRARVPVRGDRYLATRFAAKEAFSKAVGLGIHAPMTWRTCEILNDPAGRPVIALSGELARWFDARGWRAHVTVTDEGHYAAAFVVVEQLPADAR